jgi:hypothetical protein
MSPRVEPPQPSWFVTGGDALHLTRPDDDGSKLACRGALYRPRVALAEGTQAADGIPDEYLGATSTYEMTPEQRVEWEAEVRSLYHDGMVRIVVTLTWAKLIDFETTLPSAVEELVRQRAERQRG